MASSLLPQLLLHSYFARRLAALAAFDEEQFGMALHSILPSELLQGETVPRSDLREHVSATNDVGEVVMASASAMTAADAVSMVQRVRENLATQFDPSRDFVEVPFQYTNGEGHCTRASRRAAPPNHSN